MNIYADKRGGHVGVILSFVIFVTFLFFLYSITSPVTQVERGKQDLLKYLRVELLKEFSSDMTTASVLINEGGNCIQINTTEGVGDFVSVVKDDETGQILPSYLADDRIEIERNSAQNLKIYYSEEFTNGGSPLGCSDISDYEVGLTRTTEEVFASKIINMSDFINNNTRNYNTMKDKLKLPQGDEFGFIFEDGDRSIIVQTQESEVTTNIYVEEIPIQYIDNEANIKPGFLRVKVW